MVRITNTPNPAIHLQNNQQARRQSQMPETPEDIGRDRSNLGNRQSVYDSLRVTPELQEPPGMPSPRDRDSEKIAYQDYSDKHPAAFNPPAKLSRLQNTTPFSADHISRPIASGVRASVYDSLGVDPHQPPGVPSPRDLDSEKIAYQDYSDKHAVADHPPAASSRPKSKPFSPDQIAQGIGSGQRNSVYDALNVQPHQPPGVPSARDLDSEKIAYQDFSDKHPAAFNPPARLLRLRDETPFSPEQITRPVASGNRNSVYDSFGVDPHMPPGVPGPRERDSEKIVASQAEQVIRPTPARKAPVELDSNPLYEAPGDHGAKELPTR